MSKIIRSILLLVALLTAPLRVSAITNPWVDGYTDPETEVLLTGYYVGDAAAETLILNSYKKNLATYGKAAVAMQFIMAQKYLEHKTGLRDVGILGNAEENYYYRCIYTMVKNGIIPETYRCAYLLAKNPSAILYWGPFILTVCNQTIDLCGQFETVVTGGKLGFEDITFPTLNKNLLQFADLKEIGRRTGADIKSTIDSLVSFNIKADTSIVHFGLNNIKEIGISLAAAGAEKVVGKITGIDIDFGSIIGDPKISKAFKVKPEQVKRAYSAVRTIMDNHLYDPATLASYVKSLICENGQILLDRILTSAVYNAESYLSDYLRELDGQYYRQNVKVIIRDAGSEVVCDYNPEKGKTSVHDGELKNYGWESEKTQNYIHSWTPEWTCYLSPLDGGKGHYKASVYEKGYFTKEMDNVQNFDLNSSEISDVRKNSEKYANWSRSKVDQLNANSSTTGINYLYEESLQSGQIFLDFKKKNWFHQLRKYFAFSIKVTKTWSKDQIYWEKDFDSQTMDADIFQKQIEQAKKGAEMEIAASGLEGAVVVVEEGDRRYYQVPSNANIKGATMANFILNCDNHSDMGSGVLSWKENGTVGKSPSDEKLISFAERTNVEESDENPVDDVQKDLDAIQAQITACDNEIATLRKKRTVSNSPETDRRIEELEKKKQDLQNSYDNELNALQEARDDMADDGDRHRLPWLLNQIASRYHLSWKADGQWDGLKYTRKGAINGLNGVVTFEANLSQTRSEKYIVPKFLGHLIRIHRAILQLDWKVYGDQSSSTVVESMPLDTTRTEEENKQLVSDKQQKIMDMYPDCSVEVSYGKADSTATIDDTKSFHLLWVSDRLALARDINARLTSIYSNLILLHRFLYSRETLKDFLYKAVLAPVSQAMRDTIASNCFNAWIGASRTVSSRLFLGGQASDKDVDNYKYDDVYRHYDARTGKEGS